MFKPITLETMLAWPRRCGTYQDKRVEELWEQLSPQSDIIDTPKGLGNAIYRVLFYSSEINLNAKNWIISSLVTHLGLSKSSVRVTKQLGQILAEVEDLGGSDRSDSLDISLPYDQDSISAAFRPITRRMSMGSGPSRTLFIVVDPNNLVCLKNETVSPNDYKRAFFSSIESAKLVSDKHDGSVVLDVLDDFKEVYTSKVKREKVIYYREWDGLHPQKVDINNISGWLAVEHGFKSVRMQNHSFPKGSVEGPLMIEGENGQLRLLKGLIINTGLPANGWWGYVR